MPLRARRGDVPAALDRLVLRCLAAEPGLRPASPAALLPELHGFIRRGPPMWPDGFHPAVAAGPCADDHPEPRTTLM
jgi:hypothetical protein